MADIRISIDNGALEAAARAARKDALVDAAARINVRAQALSPVDTGNLRRSHKVEGPDAAARSAEVVADTPYSIYVHEGTRNQAAQPWLTRAVDQSRQA